MRALVSCVASHSSRAVSISACMFSGTGRSSSITMSSSIPGFNSGRNSNPYPGSPVRNAIQSPASSATTGVAPCGSVQWPQAITITRRPSTACASGSPRSSATAVAKRASCAGSTASAAPAAAARTCAPTPRPTTGRPARWNTFTSRISSCSHGLFAASPAGCAAPSSQSESNCVGLPATSSPAIVRTYWKPMPRPSNCGSRAPRNSAKLCCTASRRFMRPARDSAAAARTR